jgi:hypothetical protein
MDDKNVFWLIVACCLLSIFLLIVGLLYQNLRTENRELRSIIIEQQNINKELWTVNDGLIQLNDELLETVDELTKKLNGGE